MRVAQSLSTAGVGLALLATFGFAGQSQKIKQQHQGKGPDEQVVADPVHVSWEQLLERQASMPRVPLAIPAGTYLMPEPDAIELPELDQGTPAKAHTQPNNGGGSEKMVLCPSLGAEPALDYSFLAQADVPDGGGFSYIPPNVAGSVGPAHLMTMMNNKVQIQNRIGGTIASVDLTLFWGAVTAAWARVSYDAVSGRWVATARTGAGGAMLVNFAISDTNDPTGGWDFYSFAADPGGTTFPDWMPHAINSKWVTVNANMFNVAGGAQNGYKMWVIDLATALAGGPITISTFNPGYLAGVLVGAVPTNSIFPATTLDSSTATMWLLNNNFTSGANRLLQLVQMNGTGAAPVLSAHPGSPFGATTGLTFVPNNYSSTQLVMQQVGDARFIAPFSVRLQGVVVRNNKIWAVHQGGLPTAGVNRTACFWQQLDPTLPYPGGFPPAPGTLPVQGNFVDPGANGAALMPSIAVNCGDDAIIGYSLGDPTRNPECGYVIRIGSDALSVQSPRRVLKTGVSSYWKNFGVGTTAPWGFHSSSSVDPVDDKTFWTVQEYAALRVGGADNDSRWGTWWGRVGECGEPLVTDDPDNLTACVGDPASFSVSATAFVAPLTYQWRKNGVDIPGETASVFSIPVTNGADAGTYDVRVIDGCGSVYSLGAILDFAGAVVTTHPVNQNVPKGGTANFSITATGAGTLSYLWRKDGVPLFPAETNSTLVVSPVGRPDVGFYDCIVSDICGPTTSNSAVLSIPAESKNFGQDSLELAIFKQPESAIVCEGTNHTLSVTAHGENLSYLWRKGGVAIVPAETNSTLVLTNIDPSHNGSYDVIVTDNSGFLVSDSVVIDVDDLATITQHPQNVGAQNGDDVTFTVVATGDGDLTYQWQKGGLIGALNDMPGETGDTLELQNINNQDAGRYRCKVTNHCGTVFSNTAKLTLVQ